MPKIRFKLNQIKTTRVGFPTGALDSLLKKVLKKFSSELPKGKEAAVNLVWVSDKKMRSMNKQYRNKDATTDVLSFSYLDQTNVDSNVKTIGEIMISVDRLKRQAKQQKHSYKQEAEILFVHGLLHILGFDHESAKDLEQMLSAEQEMLGDKAGLIQRSTAE
jgi:probable rRNA maturation factor